MIRHTYRQTVWVDSKNSWIWTYNVGSGCGSRGSDSALLSGGGNATLCIWALDAGWDSKSVSMLVLRYYHNWFSACWRFQD